MSDEVPTAPLPAAPGPATPSSPAAISDGAQFILGLALLAATVTLVAPLCAVVWLLAVTLVGRWTGQMMFEANALFPSDFGMAFRIGLFASAAGVVFLGVAGKSKDKPDQANDTGRWMKGLCYWPWAIGAASAGLTWAWQHATDRYGDDTGYSFAAAAGIFGALVGVGPGTFIGGLKFVRGMWRSVAQSPFRAGLLAGISIVLSTVAGVGLFLFAPDVLSQVSRATSVLTAPVQGHAGLLDTVSDTSLRTLTLLANKPSTSSETSSVAAARVATGSVASLPAPKSLTALCYEALLTRRTDGKTFVDVTQRQVRRDLPGLDSVVVEVAVDEAMAEVCDGALPGQSASNWEQGLRARSEWRGIDHLRKQLRPAERDAMMADARYGSLGAGFGVKEQQALERLSVDQRCILERSILEEQEMRVAAATCGVTYDNARQLLARALKQVRADLGLASD
jgi:hypothetical protein